MELRPGDAVEVRSAAEIAATLDAQGRLDGLPFMPEMLAAVGREARVFRVAHKTCDTIEWSGLRAMDSTVHLVGMRCDGSAHGGCQAGCMLFWREEWLRRKPASESASAADAGHAAAAGADAAAAGADGHGGAAAGPDLAWLTSLAAAGATDGAFEDGAPRYRCQATELRDVSRPLKWWSPGQYVTDVRVNGFSPRVVARGLALAIVNKVLRRIGRPSIPRVAGRLQRTPREQLGLQPGDLVRVKPHAEILATLDATGRNRGLTFDPEMIPYCGGTFRVARRVARIIDEKTGRLVDIPGDCIVLDGVACTAIYHRFCPRSVFAYWREIWLERVDEAPEALGIAAAEAQTTSLRPTNASA